MAFEIGNLKMYANEQCTKPVLTIGWNIEAIIILVTGETIKLTETAKAGDEAIAKVWVRNESHFDYGITGLSFPDKRVKVSVKKAWLKSNEVTELTIIFVVPKNPTEKDIIQSNKLKIEGYYVYTSHS